MWHSFDACHPPSNPFTHCTLLTRLPVSRLSLHPIPNYCLQDSKTLSHVSQTSQFRGRRRMQPLLPSVPQSLLLARHSMCKHTNVGAAYKLALAPALARGSTGAAQHYTLSRSNGSEQCDEPTVKQNREGASVQGCRRASQLVCSTASCCHLLRRCCLCLRQRRQSCGFRLAIVAVNLDACVTRSKRHRHRTEKVKHPARRLACSNKQRCAAGTYNSPRSTTHALAHHS